MARYLIPFLLVYFLSERPVVAQTDPFPETRLSDLHLKGPVSVMRETKYQAYHIKNSAFAYSFFSANHYEFNAEGLLVEKQVFHSPGVPSLTGKYDYDASGRCTSIGLYQRDVMRMKDTLTYVQGRLHTVTRLDLEGRDKGRPPIRTDTFFYKDGRLEGGCFYFRRDEKRKTWHLEYLDGRLIRRTYRDSSGKMMLQHAYTYNERGELSSETDETGRPREWIKGEFSYTYDHHGNWVTCMIVSKGYMVIRVVRDISYSGENKPARGPKDFSGTWQVLGEYSWVTFRPDKGFEQKDEKGVVNTGKWELNTSENSIIISTKDKSGWGKFAYRFEHDVIVLFNEEGKEVMRLIRE